MIYFGFNITNPWCQHWKNVWSRAYDTPIKHKYIELEYIQDNSIMSFSFKLTTRQDHSGITFDLGLLGHGFIFNLYDNRHWNSKEGRYFIYDEEGKEH